MIPSGRIPRSLRSRVQQTLWDFADWCGSYLSLPNKEGRVVPFELLPAQRELAHAMAESLRLAVPKARQLGVSRVIRAWHLFQAWGSSDPLALATIAHHQRAASNLHGITRDFHASMPALVRPELSKDTASELVMERAWGGSTLACWSAASSSGTRSWTLHGAHLSELAYAPDPAGLLASVSASLGPSGQIISESTSIGPGDVFHRLCTATPGWDVIFLPWTLDPSYSLPLDEGEEITPLPGLSPEQTKWWRQQVATLGEDHARREYPLTLDDCFRPGSGSWVELPPHVKRTPGPNDGVLYREEPEPYDSYVMGVDPSGGVGQDFAAVTVLSRYTGQVVYCWRSSHHTPVQLAHLVLEISSQYNQSLVNCESNNHGHSVLSTLSQLGYHRKYIDPRTGKPWVTTLQSKLRAFESLRTWVLGECAQIPQALALEVSSLRLQDSGAPAAPPGMHDDLAMSLALACAAAPSVPIPAPALPPQRVAMTSHLRSRKRSPV